jgi:hypothetical protein
MISAVFSTISGVFLTIFDVFLTIFAVFLNDFCCIFAVFSLYFCVLLRLNPFLYIIFPYFLLASGRIEPSDLSALLDQMLKDLFSTWLEEAAEFDAVSGEIVQIYHETAAGNSGKVCELLAKTTKENIFSEEMARRLALVRRDSDSSGGESVMSWVDL